MEDYTVYRYNLAWPVKGEETVWSQEDFFEFSDRIIRILRLSGYRAKLKSVLRLHGCYEGTRGIISAYKSCGWYQDSFVLDFTSPRQVLDDKYFSRSE